MLNISYFLKEANLERLQTQFSSVQLLRCVRLFVTPWTAARQAPCPSPSPGVHPNPCPLSRWCHPAMSSSVVPFSSCPQSFPASGSFQMKVTTAFTKMSHFDFQQKENPSICFCINEFPSTWFCVSNKSIMKSTDVLFEASDGTNIKRVLTYLGIHWNKGDNIFMAVTSFSYVHKKLYLNKMNGSNYGSHLI